MNPDSPKILFIHIPKTAGSSFNAIFKHVVPEGRYFEHLEGRGERLKKVCEDGKPYFVSGHLTFDAMQAYIEQEDVFSITILRDPVDQLLSHLKWVKYVGSTEYPNPESVPTPILNLAKQLTKTPLLDAIAVERLIDSPIGRQLFDNLHVRYMTNARMDKVDETHLDRAIENIEKLSFIFVLEDIERALGQIRQHIPGLGSMGFQNTARINETVDFKLNTIPEIYRDLTRFDQQIYNVVRLKF